MMGRYNGDGSLLEETVWLGDLPAAVLAPGAQYFVAPDHLGAPHQITDSGGNVVWFWDHDPFGNGAPTGTFGYNLRFPGQFYDQQTGLHYNYYRDYDPAKGRYLESDPIGLFGGTNTYGYAGGYPVSLSDRTGTLQLSGGATNNNYIDPNGNVQPLQDTAPPGYPSDPGSGFMGSHPRDPNAPGEGKNDACYNYAPPFDSRTKPFLPFHFARYEGNDLNGNRVYSWVNGNSNTPGGTGNNVMYTTAPYGNTGIMGH
jgi:RHS repeat-associated protein